MRWLAVPDEAGRTDERSLSWRERVETGTGGGGGRGRTAVDPWLVDGLVILSFPLSLFFDLCLEKSLEKSTLWLRCSGCGMGGGTAASVMIAFLREAEYRSG